MKYKIIGMTVAAKQVKKPTFEVLKGKEILYSGNSIDKAYRIATENGRKVYAYIWKKHYDVVFE